MELVENLVVAERFRLLRQIGQGGMGSVWQARHLGLDIDCAIKFIEGDVAKMVDMKARFEREAKAAAQLRSPHVVQVIDHGVWQNTPFIAMELLDGEDLSSRLAQRGVLSPVEVNAIVGQVCRALSKAHQAGIVHRDLKPDNIFLVRDDDREIAKVLDFGIAKDQNAKLEGTNTKTGALMGTPFYMSPEQAQGTKAVDARSDLWSLAVIAYQCLTGVLPFQSEALGDLLVKIIVQPIPVPSMINPHLPPGFDAWWAKAASRDPNLRFQTAKELNEGLASALSALVQEGESTGVHYVGVKTMQHAGGPPQAQAFMLQPQPAPQNGYNSSSHISAGNMALGAHPSAPHMQPSMHSIPNMPTFSGADVPNGLPKKNNGIVFAGLAGGVLALVALLAGGAVVMKKKAEVGVGGPPPTESIVVTSASPKESHEHLGKDEATPPLVPSVEPPAATAALASATPSVVNAAPSTTTASADPLKSPPNHTNAPPTPPAGKPPPAATAGTPAAHPATPKPPAHPKGDLGF